MSDTKLCPYCAEEIRLLAKVCRFCNRDVPLEAEIDVTNQDAQAESHTRATVRLANAHGSRITRGFGGRDAIVFAFVGFVVSVGVLSALTDSGSSTTKKEPFTDHQICRGAVAAEMHKKASIISVYKSEGDVAFLKYTRPGDRTRYNFRCRVNGNTVEWATDTGRWRTSQHDSRITFLVNGQVLTITSIHSDGSGSKSTFQLADLGG